jgi:hypothetical protein
MKDVSTISCNFLINFNEDVKLQQTFEAIVENFHVNLNMLKIT